MVEAMFNLLRFAAIAKIAYAKNLLLPEIFLLETCMAKLPGSC